MVRAEQVVTMMFYPVIAEIVQTTGGAIVTGYALGAILGAIINDIHKGLRRRKKRRNDAAQNRAAKSVPERQESVQRQGQGGDGGRIRHV
jgi:hypothetical protein